MTLLSRRVSTGELCCIVRELFEQGRPRNVKIAKCYNNGVTWGSWRLKSPATWLFIQQGNARENIKAGYLALLFEGSIYRRPVGFPHKWPAKQTTLPCLDVIMYCAVCIGLTPRSTALTMSGITRSTIWSPVTVNFFISDTESSCDVRAWWALRRTCGNWLIDWWSLFINWV